MNPSQYSAIGGGTSLLAGMLVYFTHWPLQPLTDAHAIDLAGLLIIVFGSCHGILNATLKRKGIDLDPPPAPPAPVEAPHV